MFECLQWEKYLGYRKKYRLWQQCSIKPDKSNEFQYKITLIKGVDDWNGGHSVGELQSHQRDVLKTS